MERLWSPWRSNYIESFKTKKDGEGCVFCTIQNESMESDNCLVVHKSENCFVMLNLYPYNSGHLMVIPNRHLANLDLLTKDELNEMMDVVRLTMNVLDEAIKPQGYNFGANLGKAAGAGIDDHIHFHIVPRWTGDTNFMPAIGEVRIISQDLLATKRNFITAFKEALKKN